MALYETNYLVRRAHLRSDLNVLFRSSIFPSAVPVPSAFRDTFGLVTAALASAILYHLLLTGQVALEHFFYTPIDAATCDFQLFIDLVSLPPMRVVFWFSAACVGRKNQYLANQKSCYFGSVSTSSLKGRWYIKYLAGWGGENISGTEEKHFPVFPYKKELFRELIFAIGQIFKFAKENLMIAIT